MNSIKSKLSNCGKPGTNGATVRDTNNNDYDDDIDGIDDGNEYGYVVDYK